MPRGAGNGSMGMGRRGGPGTGGAGTRGRGGMGRWNCMNGFGGGFGRGAGAGAGFRGAGRGMGPCGAGQGNGYRWRNAAPVTPVDWNDPADQDFSAEETATGEHLNALWRIADALEARLARIKARIGGLRNAPIEPVVEPDE